MALKSVALALGATVVGWIGYLTFGRGQPVVLFSWHPITLVAAYVLATPSALLAMSDRRVESNHAKRTSLVQWHAFMQTVSVVLATVGFSAIYINKDNNNRPHFTTTHSWVGCAAITLYYLSFVLGALKTFGKTWNWQWKDAAHRIFGVINFVVSGAAVSLGLYSGGWGRANLGASGQAVATGLVALLHVVVVVKLSLTWNAVPVKSNE
ncbi:hypothetical protein H310_10107 [Aphanomyces invadans]|uniref:Cytochrome b561 domain-containing protein n=1 Tax=Aphanomyces invadans TaxID=157072 RepID=A0A024TRP3_9STRA|nr:hypothetical protein H310_10107 [Aphanomyces invadans]ETV96815.1 hypothetical protein H310_10107 [Aphanomyces invadans]|eukprot:XP_008874592.1 hypothetical protein H310_10107 [Aphanomyces invadans]